MHCGRVVKYQTFSDGIPAWPASINKSKQSSSEWEESTDFQMVCEWMRVFRVLWKCFTKCGLAIGYSAFEVVWSIVCFVCTWYVKHFVHSFHHLFNLLFMSFYWHLSSTTNRTSSLTMCVLRQMVIVGATGTEELCSIALQCKSTFIAQL